MRRNAAQAVIVLIAIVAGCPDGDRGEGPPRPPPKIVCFQQLKRSAPGKLLLRQPIACTEPVSRYQIEGPIDRPRMVNHLDNQGRSRLSYHLRYDGEGRPVFEERVFHRKPKRFKRYGGRERVEFAASARDNWQVVRIRIDIDASGNPVRMEKFVGATKAYSVTREYTGGRLKREATRDGQGRLKFQSDYIDQDGKRVERMVDGGGKVLLEREVAEESPRGEEGLDTPGSGRVQDGKKEQEVEP